MSNVANIVQNGIASPTYLVDANGNPLSTTANGDGLTTGVAASGLYAFNGASQDRIKTSAAGDGQINGVLGAAAYLYNGTGEDRQRGNLDNIALLASGAVTTNANSGDQTNYNARGVKVFIATGAFGSGASTITVSIQGKDPVSGNYFTVLTSASLTASTFSVLTVYPGIAVTANTTASDVIPRTWRVAWAASAWGTGGSTLGISCALIL